MPLLLLAGLFIFSWDGRPSLGQAPVVNLQLCRSLVEPCQQAVGILPGDTTSLDLRLQVTGINRADSPAKLVAWETHFRLTGGSKANPVLESTGDRPVQERGEGDYVLNGLGRLEDGPDAPAGRYFTIQNRHDSGSLDYSVILLDFAAPGATSPAIPLTGDVSLLLGRITLKGVADGEVGIMPAGPAENSSQFVLLGRDDQISGLHPDNSDSLLTTVNVGADVAGGEVQGRVVSQYPEDLQDPSWLPMRLNVSFWRSGAIPSWRRGNAEPLATFFNLAADGRGRFRVTDIAPALLPAGTYDLRVAGPGALTGLAPGVTVPRPGDSTQPAPSVLARLRWGDADGNNVVDRRDLAALKSAFGQVEGSRWYTEVTDLNRDRVVDGLDFSLMAQNLGRRGH